MMTDYDLIRENDYEANLKKSSCYFNTKKEEKVPSLTKILETFDLAKANINSVALGDGTVHRIFLILWTPPSKQGIWELRSLMGFPLI